MDKKLILNYFYNILYQIVKILLPIVVIQYTFTHLTPEVLGIADFAGNIMNWFILFGILGVNTYGNRQIAKVRDDQKQLTITFFEILFMQMTNMLIAFVAYYLFVFFTVKENIYLFYLTGFTMIASMLDISWFFYGVEDFKKASIRNIIVKILGVCFIFLLCKTPEDIWKYVLINAGSELLGQAIMFAQLKQYIHFEKISLKKAYQNHFFPTFQLFVPTIAISVYTMLDQTMIGYLYSELHLEYYKISMNFVKMFLYFITSIGAVMLPRVTNVYYNQKEGEKKAQSLVNTTMKVAMLLALPMCMGLMGVARDFIGWYLAENPAPIVGNLIMLGAPIIIFISMSNVTGTQYMVPTGMYRYYSMSVIFGAVTNFTCNIILIPKIGAYGALIGSLIAEGCVTLVQFIVISHKIKISFMQRSYFLYLIGSLLMFVCVYGIGYVVPISFVGTLIQIIVGIIVYFGVLIFSKEEVLYRFISKVKQRYFNHA